MENALIVLFGLTMLYISATSRIQAHIKILSFQGLLLFLICIFSAGKANLISFIFLSFETLVIKTFVIPMFLTKILHQNQIYRDDEPHIPNFYSLVISSILLFAGFLISNINYQAFDGINPIYFGVSISVIIISLFLITVRRKVLTNIIDFIAMENGIFLLSLSVAKEMPLIVKLGVLLDIFIAVFILGLFINTINKAFEDLNVSKLSDLKDFECDD
jgi:hydrogenase-4 component E